MSARICGTGGARTWNLVVDDAGHHEYHVIYRVELSDTRYGPKHALTAPGLPQVGASWQIDNDVDVAAKRTPRAVVTPVIDSGEPNKFFDIEFTYSTRSGGLCAEELNIDPLQLPQRISGSFTRYTREATHDRYGRPILSSSHEPLRGSQLEFDTGHPTVRIEQNVANLEFDLVNQMMNTLNRYPLWGLPRRSIKLSDFNWEKRYKENCTAYYTRIFEFEIKFDWRMLPVTTLLALFGSTPLVVEVMAELSTAPVFAGMQTKPDLQAAIAANPIQADPYVLLPNREFEGWDRDVLDEGYKVLNGHWGDLSETGDNNGEWTLDPVNPGGVPEIMPNPANPSHFKRFVDRDGNYIKAILDGAGMPYDPDTVRTEWYDNGLNIGSKRLPPDPGTGTTPSGLTLTQTKGGFFDRAPLGYDYTVTAITAAGESSAPNSVSFVPTPAERSIKLDWDPVPNAEGYLIYRKAFNNVTGGVYTLVGAVGATGGFPGTRRVEKYDESDFSKLGIPPAL